MLPVAERKLVEDRYVERLEVELEHVLDRACPRPLGLALAPVASLHVAHDDADDAFELSGLLELREHPIHIPSRGVVVLEEEDAAVEVDFPRRAHRLQE